MLSNNNNNNNNKMSSILEGGEKSISDESGIASISTSYVSGGVSSSSSSSSNLSNMNIGMVAMKSLKYYFRLIII